ncbi:MAG: hypothetical protein ABEH40_05020 [Haloferacaceae archaeon]
MAGSDGPGPTDRTDRLAVEAALDATVAGHDLRIEGYGDLIVVEAPSLRALRDVRGSLGAAPRPPDRLVGALPPVDVRVRGASVARIDPDADPGPIGGTLARLLGVSPARPSLGGVVRALLRTRR